MIHFLHQQFDLKLLPQPKQFNSLISLG